MLYSSCFDLKCGTVRVCNSTFASIFSLPTDCIYLLPLFFAFLINCCPVLSLTSRRRIPDIFTLVLASFDSQARMAFQNNNQSKTWQKSPGNWFNILIDLTPRSIDTLWLSSALVHCINHDLEKRSWERGTLARSKHAACQCQTPRSAISIYSEYMTCWDNKTWGFIVFTCLPSLVVSQCISVLWRLM